MNEVYVLDQELNLLGVIDTYVSIIWRPAYYDVGDFEIYLGTTKKAVELLKENNYVVRKSDISLDNSGNVTYKNVMIIKNIQLVTDTENGDYMTVTGKELKYLLHQRIVFRQINLVGNAEAMLRYLITNHAISPIDFNGNPAPNRVIPNLILGAEVGLTDTIEKQITGDYLDEAITGICTTYNYGWDIYIYNTQLIVTIYKGLDRSYSQTERPYVVFSDDFENLYNTEYQLNTESYANTALVGGEGEGVARIYEVVGDENSGLNRYETFVNASGVSRNAGNDDEIPLITYKGLLAQQGTENLAELGNTEGFTGELLSDIAFKYGVDFYLGDTVTVINKYGITKDVRVLSAIESEDDTGTKIIPQFNI